MDSADSAQAGPPLFDQVRLITNQISVLTTQQSYANAAPPPTPAVLPREPFVPAPERYYGDMGTCGDFLTQCSLVFEQQPQTYTTERSRIAYLINSTSGSARSWASAVWESQGAVCHSYLAFTAKIRGF